MSASERPITDGHKFWRAVAIGLVVSWFFQPLAWRLWGWRHIDVTLSDGTRVEGHFKPSPTARAQTPETAP